jgi:hypothetical protein
MKNITRKLVLLGASAAIAVGVMAGPAAAAIEPMNRPTLAKVSASAHPAQGPTTYLPITYLPTTYLR